MRKIKKYSLWLVPSGNVYKKLAKIIFQLSKQYSSPNFLPHVTLIGLIMGTKKEILLKTSQLVKLIKPFEIKLTKVDYLNEYFRCLFTRAVKTKELIKANLKAREIFNVKREPEFMPHLSLMYGYFNSEIKEKIIVKIGRELNLKFKIKSIYLFLTDGKPKEWSEVREFILK